MRFLLVLAVLTLNARSGHAEVAEKSEGRALMLSLGGTAASWGLLIASPYLDDHHGETFAVVVGTAGALGTLLAPSFGHWYAGRGSARGLGLRLAGAGVGVIGAAVYFTSCLKENNWDPPTCHDEVAIGIMAAGAAIFVASTIHEIATAPRSVRDTRDRALRIVPTLRRGEAGLAIGGSF